MARSDSLATGQASLFFDRRIYAHAVELALVGVAFLLYFIVRANVVDRPELAIANARDIIAAERALGILVEQEWQAAILDERLLVRFFNFVYFWLDFPLIAVLGIFLYLTRRTHYTFTRDAILISGAFALVCYSLFPVAPPRLLPEAGFIDTLQVYNNLSYQAQSTQFFVNPYAAMPSLHVGWAVLLAVGVVRALPDNRFVVVLAVLHPIAQAASTVVTGNHYLLDAAGGIAAAGLGVVGAAAMERWGYGGLSQIMRRRHVEGDGGMDEGL